MFFVAASVARNSAVGPNRTNSLPAAATARGRRHVEGIAGLEHLVMVGEAPCQLALEQPGEPFARGP